jgi:hypothetical protein
VENFRFADIRDRSDFDIFGFQCEVVEVSTDQAQSHNADSDFGVVHICRSIPLEK